MYTCVVAIAADASNDRCCPLPGVLDRALPEPGLICMVMSFVHMDMYMNLHSHDREHVLHHQTKSSEANSHQVPSQLIKCPLT